MKILNYIRGCILLAILIISTIFWTCCLYPFALLRLLPLTQFQVAMRFIINKIAQYWVGTYMFFIKHCLQTRWDISLPDNLSPQDWYLIVANHQCWLDIVLLQMAFHKKTPFIKFFLKDQLKWIPFIGLAWIGLEFPFMKRYSKEKVKRNPELKNKDFLHTQARCQRYVQQPTAILNFIEGTRFNLAKKNKMQSPYQHLLIPRSGGLLYTLRCMGTKFHHILDVTIAYPQGVKTLWQFLCNQLPQASLCARLIPLPAINYHQDLSTDADALQQFRHWLHQQWQIKDKKLAQQYITSL